MTAARTLIVTGFGLNCDVETQYAFETAGARAERIHLNTLINGDRKLSDWQILVVGGGFSWGDEHGGGVILAMRLKHRLQDDLLEFVDRGGLVLGICNGFQVLVNLGLLPGFEQGMFDRRVALVANDCGNFRDQWVHLSFNSDSPCVFTRGLSRMELPIRHGEGKFYADEEVLSRLRDSGQVVTRYATPEGEAAGGQFPENPNGSLDDIAGICDSSGHIFGLMPHPEAHNHCSNHPDWTFRREQLKRKGESLPEEGDGIAIFRNAVRYFV